MGGWVDGWIGAEVCGVWVGGRLVSFRTNTYTAVKNRRKPHCVGEGVAGGRGGPLLAVTNAIVRR